ncbi:MAG TPA: TSUP family transporter [Yinghuangia sp.]|uniref:TSUP family transporter n=1 Tax=Yinghuangia sp. YIM S10712 TaxID=3436930 RepID=UPI002B7301B5|nr:TSUP family transporter [Yinghuangia sp.]
MTVAVVVGLVFVVATALQRLTGVGFGLAAVPGLVVVLGPVEGVLLSNVAAGLISGLGLLGTWRHVRVRLMVPLVLAAAATVPVGAWTVARTPAAPLFIGIGTVVVAAVACIACGLRMPSLRGRRGAVGAGAASGVLNAAAGVGGPPVSLYAANAGWSAAEFLPNAQFYGVVVNAFSVAAKGVPDLTGAVWTSATIGLAAGLSAGIAAAGRLRDASVRRLVLGLAFAGGVVTLAKGLLHGVGA